MSEEFNGYFCTPSGTYYRGGTPEPVWKALEAAREAGERVRVFYGDTQGQVANDWLEENDVSGYVGRSMGPLKVALLRAPVSAGGPEILTDCVIRMLASSRGGVVEVYRHPFYWRRELTLAAKDADGYVWVLAGGVKHARFNTEKQARRYVAFMKGERIAK